MNCPKCTREYKDSLAKYSIEKAGMCPSCFAKKCAADAIENAKNTYEVEITFSDTITIKADDEDEAIMIATESVDGSQLTAYARKIKDGVKI